MAIATESNLAGTVVKPSKRKFVMVRLVFRKKITMVAVGFLLLVAVCAVFAPWIAPYKLNTPDLMAMLAPPSVHHLMGTDDVGIDLFTEVLYGSRISLSVGFISAIFAVVIGGTIGSIAGYFGGWVDELLMRLTDVGLSVPSLFIILGLTAVLGTSPATIVEVISLTSWMYPARLVRSRILTIRDTDYIFAARMVGCRSARTIFVHIIPNALSPLIVNCTLLVGQSIVLESVMSFLGAGMQPPNISWGYLLNQSQDYLSSAPWLAIFPGLMIFFVVLSINLLGDAIRDPLDARNR
ncbi:ABC transporter permease [Alicyclobacillus acidiphilus]|uniref:ABC transporter permease n=1 Tax=Alicyclobacillus acidiphilus TaxID=182455 RepID=UPI000834F23E|nr:ABC transporter permease [Alicyclobacillus acidiphilus]